MAVGPPSSALGTPQGLPAEGEKAWLGGREVGDPWEEASSRCREASRGVSDSPGAYSGASSTESHRCMGVCEKGEDRMASRGASPVGVLWEVCGLHPLRQAS